MNDALMIEVAYARIRISGLPLEMWLTLPFVVICLYFVFRWRKFGEDAFSWNHEYSQLACSIGVAVWISVFLVGFLSEPWHVAVFWLVAFIGTVLALSCWRNQELLDAVSLAALIVVVGVISMPVPAHIGHFLFGAPEPERNDVLAHLPRRSLALNLPDGWREIPGETPRTYTRRAEGSGLLQLSLEPPLDPRVTSGADAEKELSQLLDSIGKKMDLGKRISLSHEECASGIMAFADYQSDKHGPLRFWLIPAEVTVIASYTDGRPTVAEPEIAEAHRTLKAAKFE
jgi:hypothetical protein